MQETQQLVTIIPWTFIAQILNLFIQMYLIKRFLFKPVQEILRKRQEMTDKEINDARQAKTEAETMKTEYEAGIANAKSEAQAIVDQAKSEAEAKAEQVIRDAEAEAVSIRSRAEQDIRQERKKALNEVKNEIGGIAMEIAGKVVEKEIREEDHAKLISEFIENVGEAS